MTTEEVAVRLYELCSENKFGQAQQELFAEDAESIEPSHTMGIQTVKGLDSIVEKGRQFQNSVEEMHDGWVNEPQVYGNYIAMQMGMDVTMKEYGRSSMNELVVYEVKDGKIIKEQFFF